MNHAPCRLFGLLISSMIAVGCAQEAAPPPAPAPPPAEPEPAPEPEPEPAPASDDCQVLELEGGGSGSYTVSDGGDDHVKHHFAMPENVDALQVSVRWPDESWKLKVDLGTGHCPHSGESIVSAEGTGEAALELKAADRQLERFEAGQKWFVHLEASNPQQVGASAEYSVEVKACGAAAEEEAPAPAKPAPAVKAGPGKRAKPAR